MTNVAASLAADFLDAQGWAGILIKPACEESGIRIWFRRGREAAVLFVSRTGRGDPFSSYRLSMMKIWRLTRLAAKSLILWRPRPELNWCTRFCRPLRNHSATWPHEPGSIYSINRLGNHSAFGPC